MHKDVVSESYHSFRTAALSSVHVVFEYPLLAANAFRFSSPFAVRASLSDAQLDPRHWWAPAGAAVTVPASAAVTS